jgi:hypothetical protein
LESWHLLLPHNKHLFVGSENRSALITQFQLFAAAGSDRFLGNIQTGGRPMTTSISVMAIYRQLRRLLAAWIASGSFAVRRQRGSLFDPEAHRRGCISG